MQVHFGAELLKAEWTGSVVCIGTFDGVHLGHQRVVSTAVEHGASLEKPVIVLTFDRHPAAVLHPDRTPKPIASLDENLTAFGRLGAAVAVVMAFNRELSETPAEEFLNSILIAKLKAEELVVGHDFAFGKGRIGTPDWLSKRIMTCVVPAFEIDGRRVSSSEIRRNIQDGCVEQAAQLLGRPFEIPGVVVSGLRLGRKLGYPTVNLARSFDQVMPADGIYAGWCSTRLGDFKAAISVGVRPTLEDSARTIEAHLLDYPGDALYGSHVLLRFHKRLRDEIAFPNLEDLKAQMASDVKLVSACV